MKLIKTQLLILVIFSIAAAIAMIIHGVFFDLKLNEIKRLTTEGVIITALIIFPAILFLEWIFDLNNKAKLQKIENRLTKLEKRKSKK